MASQGRDREQCLSPPTLQKHQCCVIAQHGGTFPHCPSLDMHLHPGGRLPLPPCWWDFCLPFLKIIPLALGGGGTSSAAGCRVGCSARAREGLSSLCMLPMNIFTSDLLTFILGDQLCSPGTPQDTWYMRYMLIIRNKSVLCHRYCFQLVAAQQAAHSPNQCFPSKWLAEQFSTYNFYWFIVSIWFWCGVLPSSSFAQVCKPCAISGF